VVCLEFFKEQEKLVQLKCAYKHLFHEICIKNWFAYNYNCPLCKKIN